MHRWLGVNETFSSSFFRFFAYNFMANFCRFFFLLFEIYFLYLINKTLRYECELSSALLSVCSLIHSNFTIPHVSALSIQERNEQHLTQCWLFCDCCTCRIFIRIYSAAQTVDWIIYCYYECMFSNNEIETKHICSILGERKWKWFERRLDFGTFWLANEWTKFLFRHTIQIWIIVIV